MTSLSRGVDLQLRSVSHAFGDVRALLDVGLHARSGEVHALVGENGAGKTTLLRIVAGLLTPQRGEVLVGGVPLPPGDRGASAAAGVGVVHQHFSLVGSMTGVENYALGYPGGGVRIDRAGARDSLIGWSERTGLHVDPDVVADDLAVGDRQRLELLTALGWGARVLLLDEPTAVLSPQEADQLLEVVRGLAADGLAVILVTHKLREVERYADHVTVLRSGRVVGRHGLSPLMGAGEDPDLASGLPPAAVDASADGTDATAPLDGGLRDRLVAEMVGEGADAGGRRLRVVERSASCPGPLRVAVRGLTGERLRGIDLDLHAGQVTGVAGVAGSGQAELVGAISGLTTPAAGTVVVHGDAEPVAVDGNPARAARAGVALIPEDRERDALAPELPVWANAVAKSTGEIGGWRGVDRRAVQSITGRVIEALGVRPTSPAVTAGHLSGGNQQRLVIGRELDRTPAVVVAAEPTRGLDPASALAVMEALRPADAESAAVLVVASDLDELLMMSDRMVVLCDGRITLDTDVGDVDRGVVGAAMAGVS